jgi:hypothetical protein
MATLLVDGTQVGKADLKRTVPLAFTASETFDVGIDLGSPVSLTEKRAGVMALSAILTTAMLGMQTTVTADHTQNQSRILGVSLSLDLPVVL